MGIDSKALARLLLEVERACGEGSVLTDPEICASYARDASEALAPPPQAVVRARSSQDVSVLLKAASRYRIPITPRGAGTGRVGGAVPVQGGVVLSLEGMQQIKGIEAAESIAVVGPGVITGALHEAVEAQHFYYPPDPNSLQSCSLGGNIAANAGGPRAFKYGVTRNYVLGMEVITGDGTILQLGKRTHKGVTGYDLTALVVGSEGTLAVVSEATLKLIPLPEALATLLVFLPNEAAIARALDATLQHRLWPRCIELLDALALDIVRQDAGLALPEGARAMLLIELDGETQAVESQMQRCAAAMEGTGAIDVWMATKAGERERLWAARRELSYSMRRQAKFKLSEDVVVPRHRVGDLLLRCRAIAEERQIAMPTYGHAGDGNLHVNFLWNDDSERPQVEAAIAELFRTTLEMGGTLSGEHGIGIMKAPFLPMEQSQALIEQQKRIKALFDPQNILNPGKIFGEGGSLHGIC